MPIFQYEATDRAGNNVKDVIEAESLDEAKQQIREEGYFLSKIAAKKTAAAVDDGPDEGTTTGFKFSLGRVKRKQKTAFTRQLAILQDAGLPLLRSIRVLQEQEKPGKFKEVLKRITTDIEGGKTLSDAMAAQPKIFDRLYTNMIKAGEAGGALELILKRLAEFMEKSDAIVRQVKGAMTYPVCVMFLAVAILSAIMIFIVPKFTEIFDKMKMELPGMTLWLIWISKTAVTYWYLLLLVPFGLYGIFKLLTSFPDGRRGWHLFALQVPVFGQLVEKNIVARTMRTLGTLVSSGVAILEALKISRETAGNAIYEEIYSEVYDSIREGNTIAEPLRNNRVMPFHLFTFFFWVTLIPLVGGFIYMIKRPKPVIDDMVVNMIDVGEETGELDTMLYKIADTYDEIVGVITSSLTSLMEPIMIIGLGGAVGFIVIALFLPMIKLIEELSKQ